VRELHLGVGSATILLSIANFILEMVKISFVRFVLNCADIIFDYVCSPLRIREVVH